MNALKFNNSRSTRLSRMAKSMDWVGDSFDTFWCRDKCKEIHEKGRLAFYKKTGENYTVFSFVI